MTFANSVYFDVLAFFLAAADETLHTSNVDLGQVCDDLRSLPVVS